jgi:16S rRNA (guanine527-N7)-methyltransferase
MAISADQVAEAATRWQLTSTVTKEAATRLAEYGNLLLHWNTRISLTAIRAEADLIERHLMEGAFAAAHHPKDRTVLDYGSGTGVPGIPIAICDPMVHVTLAESQRKKSAFLQEAIRQLELTASVHTGRAEVLPPGSFDAVWMRAVERQSEMLAVAGSLVAPDGSLCILGTLPEPQLAGWKWRQIPLPNSSGRVLHIGRRF